MSFFREAMLVAGKDLRIERRSRVALQQILPFGAIVVVMFAFALDADRTSLPNAAPGLFWAAVLLAALLAIGRSFSVEETNGARDGLRLTGLDGGSMFLGKAAAIAVELFLLEIVLGLAVVVLYDVSVQGVLVLLCAAVAATVGLAAAGTVYGVLATGSRARDTLVPLLVLPAVTPVMLGRVARVRSRARRLDVGGVAVGAAARRVRGARRRGGHGGVRAAAGGSVTLRPEAAVRHRGGRRARGHRGARARGVARRRGAGRRGASPLSPRADRRGSRTSRSS